MVDQYESKLLWNEEFELRNSNWCTISNSISCGCCIEMNVDHFGIFVTFIVLAVLLSIIFISQASIQIFPTESAPQNTFEDYCKIMNIKC